MTNTYTEFCTRKLATDFTGVLYADYGKMNWTVAVNGKILVNKRNMNRWFKTEAAAIVALKAEVA